MTAVGKTAPSTLLVAGMPRSGSTWTGNVLGRVGQTTMVHEPDNEKEQLTALTAKRDLGRFPVLRSGEKSPAYEQLWSIAFSGAPPDTAGRRRQLAARLWRTVPAVDRERALGGRASRRTRLAVALAWPLPSPTRSNRFPGPSIGAAVGAAGGAAGSDRPDGRGGTTVVKTVHAPLALEWLADSFPQVRVLVVQRHPANILASWLAMRLPDGDRSLGRSPAVQRNYLVPWGVAAPADDAPALVRAAWQVCLLSAALQQVLDRRPDFIGVRHEQLCVNPVAGFTALAGALGLPWNGDAERFLRDSDRPGDGFAVQRAAADQPERWRSRLSTEAIMALDAAARQFPGLEEWSAELRQEANRAPASRSRSGQQ